jgi:hypothetical protein
MHADERRPILDTFYTGMEARISYLDLVVEFGIPLIPR